MANNPTPEGIARAARLRADIERMTNPSETATAEPSNDSAPVPLSPREFIEREMRKPAREK